ncbi:MAG: hypothetical protein GC147_10845 [Porphyrobacter sp.]|nr:hypothetical protein [Porphyrobacter sp.]
MSGSPPLAHPLMHEIAVTLGTLAGEAETFGTVLCGDADFAARHLGQLQQIDRIAQSLREIARVMAASDPAAAVTSICLGDLRARLETALVA